MQIGRRLVGGREQLIGQDIDRLAERFFWPGPFAVRPQARFDMAQRDGAQAGRLRARHRAGGIALHDDAVRPHLLHQLQDWRQRGRDIAERVAILG